jgi:NAD(P)-dependent dehydrogenase (short-subunit alcohol dehydrogenase family)
MGRLDDRVVIVTGAGRGLGRAHALRLAEEGATVIVNDIGAELDGSGGSTSPAQQVVDEIVRSGGRAIANFDDISDWEQAGRLVQHAIDTYGDLHALVNNAGNLRDRTLANMSESEWDDVVRVHLKGHAAPTHHALAYWRGLAKAGREVRASVVHTTSVAGLAGNFGQANYSAAKLGIVALSRVVAMEGARIGVRSNAVSPSARTRLIQGPEAPEGQFDPRDPANVSPLVAWLCEAGCPANGQIFQVYGSRLYLFSMPTIIRELDGQGRWTPERLESELGTDFVEHMDAESLLARFREATM